MERALDFYQGRPGSNPVTGGKFFQLCFIPLLGLSCGVMTDRAYFVKSTPYSFHWIFSKLCTCIADIVKKCMLEFDAEKILFDKMGGFLNIKAIL